MYWHDFKALILRHAPNPTNLQFIKHDNTPPDIYSIFDLTLARRAGQQHTGHTYEDTLRDGFVCNAAYLNGEIPMVGWKGSNMTDDRPARGVKTTLKVLLDGGSIRPSHELDAILGESSRELAPRWMRLHYDEVPCE